MNKQEMSLFFQKKIDKVRLIAKKLSETIRFFGTKDKVLLNVWIRLFDGQVIHSNLGDDLNFYILESLTRKPLFNLSSILCKSRENILMIGSIIEALANKDSVIWGSGAMYGGEMPLKEKPKKVLAVRGPLTRGYLLSQGVDCPEVYGDPALLLPRIYNPQPAKKYKLGVIPHNVDIESEYLSELRNDVDVRIIRLKGYEDWHKVIDEICECEFIISSSLHGLIISDAYGIPNLWIKLSNKVLGGDFKYFDYFMSVGREVSEAFLVESSLSKEDFLAHRKHYAPIKWDSEKLLESSPFDWRKIDNLLRN